MPLLHDHVRTHLKRSASLAMDVLLETLWPTRCALCDTPGDLICPACRRTLRFVDVNRACPVCGAPFGQHQCTECNDTVLASAGLDELPIDGMASALLADDAAKRIVTVFKDANEQRLAAEIARITACYIPPEWHDALLTYIPATADAVRRRGFDHTKLIARAVADCAQMQGAHLFERPENLDQRTFGRHERQRNMAGRFRLLPQVQVPAKVVVLDDICTTGATMFAAARCLREGGVAEVYGITFAKVLAT